MTLLRRVDEQAIGQHNLACNKGKRPEKHQRKNIKHVFNVFFSEADIAVVGNVFSFVFTKYPSDWRWRFLKV
jgi:hypothetical protein